jgi:hypothetical protein
LTLKLVRTEILFDHASVSNSDWFRQVMDELREAIDVIRWPVGSDDFCIYPVEKANGVKPIKEAFVLCLAEKYAWTGEFKYKIPGQTKRGPVDAARLVDATDKMFAVEWETGNVSSSHRALNKMALGIIDDILCGGILVLPSRRFYKFLTDRVGNFQEMQPYFPIWKNLDVSKRGILAVIEIEHDRESMDVPRLTKGTDGRALV